MQPLFTSGVGLLSLFVIAFVIVIAMAAHLSNFAMKKMVEDAKPSS